MADYFSEYAAYVGSKSLPSPADTPYETPSFIRSKRSSRATAASSREHSESPPPLPPDASDMAEKTRDGRYSAMDPRRFTPTLHASLVSEILNLRRELDSKNALVENLETIVAGAKTENETLADQLAEQQREVRKAKSQVERMEKGAYDAVEELVKERDAAKTNAEDLKSKLEAVNKRARRQDEDAVRTQGIWDQEKESWENERRQLERRIHITENHLRTVVEEVAAQQQRAPEFEAPIGTIAGDDSVFKDSGLGNESDNGSIRSATPVKHRRNMSSISFRARSMRNSASSRASAGTPDLQGRIQGNTLADELGIDEEDEYDMDDFEHADDEADYPEPKRRTLIEVRRDSNASAGDAKAKRILGITTSPPDMLNPDHGKHITLPESPTKVSHPLRPLAPSPLGPEPPRSGEMVKRSVYVNTGYQPSPPPSPERQPGVRDSMTIPIIKEPVSMTDAQVQTDAEATNKRRILEAVPMPTASPISPPETPIVGDNTTWQQSKRMSIPPPAYSDACTQTEAEASSLKRTSSHASKRDSLSPPSWVPAIAIHPPTSRPSSPRSYVLPPGTKDASTQASMPWPGKHASVQTEEIRIDERLRRLPSYTGPSSHTLLPSPTFPDPLRNRRPVSGGTATVFTNIRAAPSLPSPPLQSPTESSPEVPRSNSAKNLRDLPLRAIPLGRPVLAPVRQANDSHDGPLNRSSQYGVTRPLQSTSQLTDIDHHDSDDSDYDDVSNADPKDITGSIPAFSRPPQGRFGLSNPPKVVPEDKEISPDRRPGTAESYGAAPAPSVASSRGKSQRLRQAQRPPAKLNSYRDIRSRSPSFGSVASSSFSAQSVQPPFAIPKRSSSRVAHTLSEGSHSPTPQYGTADIFGRGGHRSSRPSYHARQNSLRKVQSAAVMRSTARVRTSPQKGRRRRRSPDLSPIRSMALDTPAPTRFPIPSLPTPLTEKHSLDTPYGSVDMTKGSVDLTKRPSTAVSVEPRNSEETHLVDAIAATMVGEWMWKYIRKRKSFGIAEEPTHDVGEGAANFTGHGTRHKRWVWLSPYERTIMWDNKQPTSGDALLGKKGRKLSIQAVLDVEDSSPLPRGAELQTAFHRSILILTPQRALKFTAVSRVRHELWMTALGFLAQSGRLPQQFPAEQNPPQPKRKAPVPPPIEALPQRRPPQSNFGRATIRDSVRLAKGRRPSFQHSQTDNGIVSTTTTSAPNAAIEEDPGADFPAVPRLYISTAKHQRKRSNTSPRLPPPLNNLRSISSSAIPSSSGGSSRLHPFSTAGSSVRGRSSSSKSGGSRQDSIVSPDRPNFFEAVGTLRMEAFVDPNMRDGVLYVPAPPPSHHGAGPRRRRGDSNISASTLDKRRAGFILDEDGQDPFKGF